MTSLCAALDGVALIWTPDGGGRRVPVAEFVVGDRRTVLAPGEVLRTVHLPAAALRLLNRPLHRRHETLEPRFQHVIGRA